MASTINNIISLIYNTLARIFKNILTAIKASRSTSEGIFSILKIIMGMALFMLMLMIIYQAIRDHEKISVKPFSVPEAMRQKHNAVGSIVANIIKQDLAKERSKVDRILTTDMENGVSSSAINRDLRISNDTNFFNGVNIKLPGTAITVNDIVDFISVLFGRQTITGSIYEDSGNLYLQVEINGKILTAQEALPKESQDSLNISTIERMSKKASKSILQLSSEKYQLYYYCLSDEKGQAIPHFENAEYRKLSGYCKRYIEHTDEDDIAALKKDIEDEKQSLKDASGMERFVINLLSNKLSDVAVRLKKASTTQPSQPTPISETVDTPPSLPELMKLTQECLNQENPDTRASNDFESKAGNEYNNANYKAATDLYIQSIKANCNNPYAWANLGILLSDLNNTENFNATKAAIALQRATEIKTTAGWMWHSLCVAQMYAKDKNFEESLESDACQEARRVEPGKQLIYEKLFYTAIADKYKKQQDYKKAFKNYDKALSIDPKRTCRFKSILDNMFSIRKEVGEKIVHNAICKHLADSYPVDDTAQICEEALTRYEDGC